MVGESDGKNAAGDSAGGILSATVGDTDPVGKKVESASIQVQSQLHSTSSQSMIRTKPLVSTKLHNSSGTVPVISVKEMSSSSSRERRPNVEGIEPVSMLLSRYKIFN